MGKGYYISRQDKHNDIVYLDYDKITGYDIKPHNSDKYGIIINKMIIVKPSMIEKLLIKKTQNKLDMFLKKILYILEDDSSDDSTFREALNDISRYKNIINYKYRKYLDDKYVSKLNKKVEILNQELKRKILYLNNNQVMRQQMYHEIYQNMYNNQYEEKTTRRAR